MADIRPFRGWHYTGEVSDLIAPPYDILSPEDKAALLAKSADNIVAVDLPHVPPKSLGPQEAYTGAAAKLAAMQEAGTLVRDAAPALYAYSQTYVWAGQTYTRRALTCGVRATELCRDIWPHEETFAGPKADRLRLTEATRTLLSPIFGFYEDTGGAGRRLWESVGDGEPTVEGRLNDVTERLWVVTDDKTIAAVCNAMAEVPIFIADGHHRYTTALDYRNARRDADEIDEDHETNFVLFTLVAMDDPGLLVLPTHRMISGIADGYACEELMAETDAFVQWQEVAIGEELLGNTDAALASFGAGAMAFLDANCKVARVARLTEPKVMDELAPDQCPAWRGLDVSVLQKVFLERHIFPHVAGEGHPGYSAYGREVIDALTGGRCQLAAMLQGTPLSAVKEIALAKAVMPHKSTYFYPKLATGMVLKPLQ